MRIALWLVPLLASASAPAATFYRDVLPILQNRCQVCHRPGEIGTGSFLTWQSTRPWARAIKEKVLSHAMPPWFANPLYGHFSNDRQLTGAEIQTLASWADGGAPEGNPKDRPPRPNWSKGWNIEPDIVFESRPVPVPAKGVLDYIYIVIPTNFDHDMAITAGEIRPSDPSVVHHMSAFWRPPDSAWLRQARPLIPYTIPQDVAPRKSAGTAAPEMVEAGAEFLVGYSPGMPAQQFGVGRAAKLIPAGSDLVFEVHLTPNGRAPAAERIQIAFTFATQAPARRFVTVSAWTRDVLIAPGDPSHAGHATLRFNRDAELVSLQPHMHLRGRDMTIRLVYPDGRTETLLDVPHYNFDWQLIYSEQHPLPIPKGARIEVTAHWDNSANNPRNPDPTAVARLGPQNTDEMLVCNIGFTVEWWKYSQDLVTVEDYQDQAALPIHPAGMK